MNVSRTVLVWLILGMLLLPASAMGQEAAKTFKPEELDQMVAPIALHPDKLVAQILMASTYPLEVVQAARFVKDNPKLSGDQLSQALQQHTWDDSVKSLVFFPQVITMMNEKLDWLQKLGDAFLSQQQDVLAAVQRLRARAQAAGQLKSTAEQNVIVEAAGPAQPAQPTVVVQQPPQVIRIESANPQVVYVPSYDPTVVYGAWPPAYPPYYPYPPGYFAAGAFTFFAGAAVGAALWGDCNWNNGDIDINNNVSNNFTNNVNNKQEARARVEQRQKSGGTGSGQNRGKWQHSPEHRKGVQYRDNATQQRFNRSGPANAQSREAFRGRTQGGGDGGRAGAGGAQVGTRDRPGGGQPGIGQQPAGGGLGDRGAPQATQRAGGGAGQGGLSQSRQAGGFDGLGSARDTQSFSNRGNASRESFSRSSGASRGGGGRGGGGRGGGRR